MSRGFDIVARSLPTREKPGFTILVDKDKCYSIAISYPGPIDEVRIRFSKSQSQAFEAYREIVQDKGYASINLIARYVRRFMSGFDGLEPNQISLVYEQLDIASKQFEKATDRIRHPEVRSK